MKILITPFLVLITSISLAQECDPEVLAKMPGRWKGGMPGSVNGIKASDYQSEKATLQKLQALVASAYKPQGVEVSYSYAFSKYGDQQWFGDPYYFAMYILAFLCDPNDPEKKKYYVAISSATNVTINVNQTYNGDVYASTLPSDHLRGYLRIDKMPVKKDGYWEFEEVAVKDRTSNFPTMLKEILICYGDSLPFEYMTRKEYLQLTRKRLEITIKQNSGSNYYQKYMDKLEEDMGMSAEELAKPAICKYNDEERYNGFVEHGTPGSFVAIKPNPAYYRKNLPLSAPQFMTIVYKYTKNDRIYEDNTHAIENAIDIKALKNMLGKNIPAPATAPSSKPKLKSTK